MERKRKLLVISSGYPNESGDYLAHTFVKGFVDEAKNYFSQVMVLALLPIVPRVIKKLVHSYDKPLHSYTYDNVSIMYRKYPYLPIWPFSKFKGDIAHLFLSKEISMLIDQDTVIHANFTSPGGVFANRLTKKNNGDFTLTVHEDHNWLLSEIESKNRSFIDAWKNAKAIIRVNKLDIDLLSPYNKNLFTIANGYNHRKFKLLDREECRNTLNIKKSTKVLINIGFYKNQKNQKLLISAIKRLPEEILKNLKCYIIGGGPLHDELLSQIKSEGLESVISLEGQVLQNKLPLYLNAADLFCLSSDSEGNPTVMFEALGVGLPYIGTNVGGVPEIIISEDYGLICEPNNEQQLSSIIEEGIKKEWDRDGILQYSKQFTWENIFLETQKHY